MCTVKKKTTSSPIVAPASVDYQLLPVDSSIAVPVGNFRSFFFLSGLFWLLASDFNRVFPGSSSPIELQSGPHAGPSTKGKMVKDNIAPAVSLNTSVQPEANISRGSLRGVIRGSSRVVKSDTTYMGPSSNSGVAFRTDASALGSYTPPAPAVSGKRRFSELPVQSVSSVKEQPHTTYRDRAAE